ncbi:ribonuclease H-like domain-containing protein [Tanacetum coccineum]
MIPVGSVIKAKQTREPLRIKDELSSEPNDDGRDSRSKIDKGTDQFSHVGTENTGDATRDDVGHPDDNTSAEAYCDNLESAILDEKDGESEVMHKNWHIYQLDINNAFMYGELVDDVYMSLPEGYFDKVDNKEWCYYCLTCVDDIVITGNNVDEINRVKEFLSSRPCGTPLETKECTAKPKKVYVDSPLTSINNYQKLVGKLIYLTHTRPDISYVVHVLSQYVIAPLQSHLKLAFRVLKYLKNAFGKGIYLVKEKELNLNVFVDSDWAKCKAIRKAVTSEYRAMNTITCEVIWIQKVLSEVPSHCDNSFAIQIAANPVFHEKNKNSKIELFFLIEKVLAGVVTTV